MTDLLTYLQASIGDWPEDGVVGKESEWLPICELELAGNWLCVVDPMVMNRGDGLAIKLPAGIYHVQGKAMDFQGHRRSSRLRAWNSKVAGFIVGKKIGTTGTDTGTIAIVDIDQIEATVNEFVAKEFNDRIFDAICEDCGLAEMYIFNEIIRFAYVRSGFGDGTFDVFPLIYQRKTIGMEIEFLPPNFAG